MTLPFPRSGPGKGKEACFSSRCGAILVGACLVAMTSFVGETCTRMIASLPSSSHNVRLVQASRSSTIPVTAPQASMVAMSSIPAESVANASRLAERISPEAATRWLLLRQARALSDAEVNLGVNSRADIDLTNFEPFSPLLRVNIWDLFEPTISCPDVQRVMLNSFTIRFELCSTLPSLL